MSNFVRTIWEDEYQALVKRAKDAEARAEAAEAREASLKDVIEAKEAAAKGYYLNWQEAQAEIASLKAALEEIGNSGIETFHINEPGGPNIIVEGSTRFAHERDVARLIRLARAALTTKENSDA